MVQVSAAVDGITNQGVGWTNQSSSPYSSDLESYAGPNSTLFNAASYNGYSAWSMIAEDALASVAATTTDGYLTRVFVPANFANTKLDVIFTSSGTVTNAVFALYTATGVNPLAWTADVHTTVSGTAGLYSLTWNGSSSPLSVNLTGGQFYYVYAEVTGTSPTIAGSTAASAVAMNPNLSLSATVPTLNSAVLATSAPTAITATTTLAWGTNWALSASKFWFGLR